MISLAQELGLSGKQEKFCCVCSNHPDKMKYALEWPNNPVHAALTALNSQHHDDHYHLL